MTRSDVSGAQELEALLAATPGVRSAAAGARNGQLVGWVVARGAAFSMNDVYAHVARRASPNAVPEFLLLVDDIPVLPDGEVDRHSLVWP